MDKRDKLAQHIKTLIESETGIKKNELSSEKFGRNSNYKNGIYYIYDDSNNIIYAGKVGDSKSTSLYDRMIGHGDGSHSRQEWWNCVSHIKFRIFESESESQLFQFERLAIIAAHNPKCNDKIINENDIDILTKLLPPMDE